MALTLNVDDIQGEVSLEEYVALVNETLDSRDIDSIIATAPCFKKLVNNRRLILDFLADELRNWEKFQTNNRYSGQTIVLHNADRFFVRANVWVPPRDPGTTEDWERSMFAYLLPHDHNFTFMTGGYFGSGYATTIYEYDHESMQNPADPLDLVFLESTSLTQGKVMLYRESRDIHSQEHPRELSISLNLMVPSADDCKTQYIFDVERRTAKPIQLGASAHVLVCELAGLIGNGDTVNRLEAVSRRHGNDWVRAEALKAMARLDPSRSHEILSAASQDKSPLVKLLVK